MVIAENPFHEKWLVAMYSNPASRLNPVLKALPNVP
jgi:hypothetical protein